jgi:hypothetical protein
MGKRDKGPVTRWVLQDRQGRFATNSSGGQFTESLADAHIYVGRPEKTETVTPIEVRVEIVRTAV